ncbi:MAG: hypothetical protein LJE95_16490 [Acidobacteria bacterium]|jgi:hypothetical protein|nr:hypothetical protein [Acidobacteriota bacterium]
MMELYHFLEYKQPRVLGDENLQRLLVGTKLYPSHLKDAWGNRFQIKVEPDASGQPHYTIRSYGADHRRGDCCSGFVYHRDWDADAVLKDGRWLQVWAEVP